jgi:hypothetical protein
VTVDATDALGNASSDSSESICVNKDQISGEISQDTLSDATYNFLRDVDFVVTDASGDVLGTWTVTVDFVNDPDPDGNPLTDDGVATGSYVLTNVTGGVDVAGLSADTASTLREKQAVTLDGDGQATVDFTGADQLRPGDLNDSNSVTILDYSILKAAWNTADPVADMNGDGLVKTFDYLLLKTYWFDTGDDQ